MARAFGQAENGNCDCNCCNSNVWQMLIYDFNLAAVARAAHNLCALIERLARQKGRVVA